jgi:tetratricopeptide (TPR) repeat protein
METNTFPPFLRPRHYNTAIHRQDIGFRALSVLLLSIVLLIAGCAVPPPQPTGPSPEEIAKQQRIERANTTLADATKQYDIGSYDDAMKSFLLALDSGALTPQQQLAARKKMAFIHCVSNREINCKEEFEKSFALDPKFDLSPAEAGHPIWGPVFRNVKNEVELRRSGRTVPVVAPKVLSAGEKLIAEGMAAYDAADYVKSVKSFQDALKETLSTDDQIKARKFTAFSFCLSNRVTLCRQEFEKILQAKPDFDLAPAEIGHPSWGPSFRNAKSRQRPAIPTPTPQPSSTAPPAKK